MMVTKEKPDKYLTLDNFFFNSEAPKISNPEVPKKQERGKFTTVAQELGERLNDYVRFTFSSGDFKEALKDKFGGNINQFNQNLVLFALTLAHMEKAAEKDEELKKSLLSLQEKMKAVNENIGKIAKELGYTVSQYSLDKLVGKDLKGVKETLAKDFGVEPKLEGLFSRDALNSLEDLFAFIVNKFYQSRVNAPVATVPIISDTEDNKEKGAEGENTQPVVAAAQLAGQPVFKQTEQPVFKQQSEEKQNKDYHSPLRGAGKKITITGGVLGVLGGVLFAGGFVYLPMAAFGLAGIGLAALGFPLAFVGGFTWVAGVISEAIHNHRVPKAQDEEEKRKKALEKKEKKRIEKEERIKRDEEASENKDQVIKNNQSALESPHEDIRREKFSIFNLAYKLVPKLESRNKDIRREALSIVEHGLKSQDPEIRNGALSMLEVALESPYRNVSLRSMFLLGEALKSQDSDVRVGAITILGKALKSQNEEVRTEALWLLKGAIKSPYENVRKGVLPLLKDTFESPSYPVGAFLSCVGAALESIDLEVRMTAMSLIKENLKSEDPNKRRAATTLLNLVLEHNSYTDVRNEAIAIKTSMQKD